MILTASTCIVYVLASNTFLIKNHMAKLKVRIKTRKLLLLLAKRNMSANGLARGAELQSGHVSQLINGKRNVSPDTREKILRALPGIEFQQIFSIL